MAYDVRKATNWLLGAIEEGTLDPAEVVRMFCASCSEQEVREVLEANEITARLGFPDAWDSDEFEEDTEEEIDPEDELPTYEESLGITHKESY